MYNYGILRTDSGEDAKRHNDKLLGPNTLGLEVTRAVLAARCGLGNLDPQHDESTRSDSSAIRESVIVALPPSGSTLVSIRPDADSFGAMAVLTARLEGKEQLLRHDLIATIHLVDCYGPANAQQTNPWISEYRLEGLIITQISRDSSILAGMREQVLAIMNILIGNMPRREIERIASLRKMNDPEELKLTTIISDKVIMIETNGQYNFARQWGSARFPVTIICDHEYVMPGVSGYAPHKRWCIVRAFSQTIDMEKLKQRLNEAESAARGVSLRTLSSEGITWGGPKNLVSSPQSKESALSSDNIVAVVSECTQT